ncbi:ATP-binding protein [Rhizobium pusense]|uniref:sensor histidine kinase n=1 Tax=Agrobacterium pusense TaxID=648995 RepID=UPI0024488AE3|nr:ATP-binding protein [Agrobacterium pusense]MDH0117792.1 ATP-binding protein [Agrobacterium pusense]
MIVVWLVVIANVYRSYNSQQQNVRPPPDKIAAIVDIVERAGDAGERRRVLDAVRSNLLDPRLEDDRQRPSEDAAATEESLTREYGERLGDRAVKVTAAPITIYNWTVGVLSAKPRNILKIRIALRTGDVLVINSKTPYAVSPLGVPVGFGAGLIGTVIALVMLLVLWSATLPLSELARAVDKIDFATEPAPLPRARSGTLEIRALAAAFDRLQIRLSHLLRSRMALLGGISHDVRTFATRLRLRIDQIPDAQERDRAIEDISDMIRLLDDALLASRAGAGELSEELLEFEALVTAEVHDRRSSGHAVESYIDPNAVGALVLGDRLSLRRVISNLIDNALKYGIAARVHVQTTASDITLRIDDDGPGIPADFRQLLLEPFVRIETSRNRSTGGAGLGLSIVRNLVEAHGGAITIGQADSGGASVIVALPLFVPT